MRQVTLVQKTPNHQATRLGKGVSKRKAPCEVVFVYSSSHNASVEYMGLQYDPFLSFTR